MVEQYQSALRSCYYKSMLAQHIPNPSDPLHQEFQDDRHRADTRFTVLALLGVPMLILLHTKVLHVHFAARPFVRSGILSLVTVGYVLAVARLGYSEEADNKLTTLARRYEVDLLRICPDVRKFSPSKS